MADFTSDTKENVRYRNDKLLPAGTSIDIKKDGVSLPGFPKTVSVGKEFDATIKITGELRTP